MKNLIILASVLFIALVGTLLVLQAPSHTDLLEIKQQKHQDYNGKYYKDCSKETNSESPCSCNTGYFEGNKACQRKADCSYHEKCSDYLINCNDAQNAEFCGCGASTSTAECCVDKSQCKYEGSWWSKSWKCKAWCKDKQ